MARLLSERSKLTSLEDELSYMLARLEADPDAADLAPVVAELLERIEGQVQKQRRMWRAEIVAQARVDAANEQLDRTTNEFVRAADHVIGDRRSPRFVRYFPVAPNLVIRKGLESQIQTCRGWPDALRGEPEDILQGFAARFEEAFAAGDAALELRRKAAGARADHRLRELLPLIDDLNNARRSLDGVLRQRGVERNKPRDWAMGFFLRGRKSRAPREA